MFQNKNVLVTGGAGFVGANLINRLITENANIRASLHKKDAVIHNSQIDYVWADLERPEDCKRVCKDMEYVFLCAAVTAGAELIENKPLFLLTPNLLMNTLMLEAAYEAGVKKVLFISSNTVYPVTDYPVKEDEVNYDFYEKYFIAGWMKRFCEVVCEMYSTKIKKPLRTVIVRPGNMYGPYDNFDFKTSHVLPALIRRVVERHNPLEIWGNGQDIKDFIFIDDAVEGMLCAMKHIHGFDVVNIAGGVPHRLCDLLDLIIKLDGFENANIQYDATKPMMIPKRLIDTQKSKKIMGFECLTSIEEGLKKTIEWYRRTS